MNKPFPKTRRALIAGDQLVEVLDLGNYLEISGWTVVHTATDASVAGELLRTVQSPYDVVIVALRQDQPAARTLLNKAVVTGSAVIVINGSGSNLRGPQIAFVSRPYGDRDLDAAFARLALDLT
ncbi:MAG: hypothetical protein AAFN94_02430 [Pseudomonadota bacterium]